MYTLFHFIPLTRDARYPLQLDRIDEIEVVESRCIVKGIVLSERRGSVWEHDFGHVMGHNIGNRQFLKIRMLIVVSANVSATFPRVAFHRVIHGKQQSHTHDGC